MMSAMDEQALAELEARMNDPDAWGDPVESPRHAAHRQRGAVIGVWLPIDELARLQTYAAKRQMTLAGALRTAALEASQRES